MTQKLSTFQQIRELKPWSAQAFCLAILARMVPHFAMYQTAQDSVVNEYGDEIDAGLAEHVLNLLWLHLAEPKNKFNIGVQLEKIEAATPDMHEGDAFGVLPAMDACLGLAAVLRMLQNEQMDAPVMVSKLAQGGVEAYLLATDFVTEQTYLESLTDPEEYDIALRKLNNELKAHPLMAFEVNFQQEILRVLADSNSGRMGDRSVFVKKLKALVRDTEITTLGIELAE
jgi:uncharacterized protein YjaG (DUF416 family)